MELKKMHIAWAKVRDYVTISGPSERENIEF